MYAQSHRSNTSMSNLSLPMDEPFTPPTHRLSMPVAAGGMVESPTRAGSRPRSKSPLRNSMTFDQPQSTEGSPMPHDDDPWGQRGGSMYSPSLTNSAPSVARFANNLAQRVNSLFSEPRSPSLMPSDAQLEAEAAAERDRSRREAERILNHEAEERRRIEEGVMQSMRQNSLPPPPSTPGARGRSTSPARKEKDGWWNAAKQRLTPTKELTPAQQIVQETKAKEKRGKSKDVSPGPGRERTLSTPSIPPVALQQNVSPNALGASPNRDAPPLYAQFRQDGALDVTSTLVTIARRFEKLERWTVGHVRALEERMNDVEKYLVDKEKEKDKETGSRHTADPSTLFEQAAVAKDVEEMKDELSELKGRITEIGREFVVLRREASRPLPTAPAPAPAPTQAPPQIPAVSPVTSPLALGSTFSSGSINSTSSRTRSYPVGDYRSNNSSMQSPPTSPPPRASAASPPGPSLAQTLRTPSPLPPVAERTTSPSAITPTTPQPSSNLPAPPAQRPPSVSPPRKRYTVALGGGPISQQREQLQTAYFSSVPTSDEPGFVASGTSESDKTSLNDDAEDGPPQGASLRRKETIGSTPISISRLSLSPPARAQPDPISTSPSPMGRARPRPQSAVFNTSPSPGNSRMRTQSTYGGTGLASPAPPRIDPHNRSKSIDRFGLGLDTPLTPGGTGKFVDPLLARRKDTAGIVSPKPVAGKGKIPIGQLVAFFDGDKNTS
ncbi:hypothetical protein EXIGLDRAFT_769996 [Exidia glandulosa HHB12029]|uniref:Uncharacterized protein n=1 Tax=Exidia glandulosa HHB12029 TaxID=1314781 RepID=A0A165H2C1_EXIGL|nr:hypothetical protein EXIGLDRAFT_769996 [Exidia glandulosa HHB12029]